MNKVKSLPIVIGTFLIIIALVMALIVYLARGINAVGYTPYVVPNSELKSTAEALIGNPVALPDTPRILSLSIPPGSTLARWDRPCISLHQISLRDKDTETASLTDHLLEKTVITVDNHPVKPTTMMFAIMDVDEDGNPGPGPIEFCFTINLPSGPHYFRFETESPSGKKFEYDWAWLIK